MTNFKDKQLKNFPEVPKLSEMIGPSFLILALGLGSGEIILWPYLVSNYGLGVIWGAVLGITFQYFINMEIERYALAKGESVFVGLKRLFPWAPKWFILSTFLGFGLPGIVAASAQVLAKLIGLEEFKWLAIVLLLLIGLILGIGKTVYQSMEKITQIIILLGIPFLLFLCFFLIKPAALAALAMGMVGVGDGYLFLPARISLATFLAAFAYAGAGGNLNLTQSIYIKEKGYGMGKYAEKMGSLFRAKGERKEQTIELSGSDFAETPENLAKFHQWWRVVGQEHAIIFWGVGLFTILLLALLSYATTYGLAGNQQGILFILKEAGVIGGNLLPWLGGLFLLVVGIMLFQTELGVLDSTSRIMAENLALEKMDPESGETKVNLSKIYFSFLWAQIGFGIFLFLINLYEPKTLLIAGAVVNAVAMFVHVGMVHRLNQKLPIACRPAAWRIRIMAVVFGFLGIFGIVTLVAELAKFL